MSGPKIIDIEATRFAERARINTLCARIEAAMARHQAHLEKSGQTSPVDISMADQLRRKAEEAEDIYSLMALRDQAGQQLQFIKSESSRLRQSSIENTARSRAASSAVNEAITRMLEAATDPEEREALQRARDAEDPAEKMRIFESALEKADAAKEESGGTEAIVSWLAENMPETGDATEEMPAAPPSQRWRLEIERIRAESTILAESAPELAASIEKSIARIEGESNTERRLRLLDDLRYPLAEELRKAREAAKRAEQIGEWRAALAIFGEHVDLAAWEARFAAGETVSSEEIEEAVAEAIAISSAQSARREVLKTLESLGYELRTGMESAFVVEGKIVIKKPNDLDYGVELSTFPQGDPSLIRTRVVRTRGQEADTDNERLRDKEREESWCEDREEMTDLLAEAGINCEIKTQRAAGDVPVEVVASDFSAQNERREGQRDLKTGER